MSSVVTFEQLKTITGYSISSCIEACLNKNGVRFLYGRNGGIFTTVDALNAAMGIAKDTLQPAPHPEIDIL